MPSSLPLLGPGMVEHPAPGALIAHDLGDAGPDGDRRFLFGLIHDHDTVAAAARNLLARVKSRPEVRASSCLPG